MGRRGLLAIGGGLVHQVEVNEFETFHSDFSWRTSALENFDHGLDPFCFFEYAETRRRIYEDAKEGIEDDRRQGWWRSVFPGRGGAARCI